MRSFFGTMVRWIAASLAWAWIGSAAGALEHLPETGPPVALFPETPAMTPMTPLTSEAGFFARWRADHQERAARDGWIETDRPSFTLSSATVPRGWLQVETGYTYAYNDDIYHGRGLSFERVDSHTAPETTVRYGLLERLELRTTWNGVTAAYLDLTDWHTYCSDLDVGIKWQATQQRRFIPQSALVCSLLLPTGDNGYPSNSIARSIQRSPFTGISDQVRPVLNYVYSWSLSEYATIGGSTGGVFATDEEFAEGHFFQSIIYRYHCSPSFDMFVEVYFFSQDFYAEKYTAGFADWGLRWRPLANLQLDARIGADMRGKYQSDGLFTGVGLSVRY